MSEMPHFLPTPYPDELWYSVLCRYHLRSGNSSPQHSAQDIFGYKKQKVSVELATDVQRVLEALKTPFMSAEEVLLNHTLLPFYARFWGAERKKKVAKDLSFGTGAAIHKTGLFQSKSPQPRVFWHCNTCFEEDLKRYGESYWHRAHQLADVRVCTRHRCWLSSTNMPLYNHQKIFCPVMSDTELKSCDVGQPTKQELALAERFIENLWVALDMDCDSAHAQVLDYHLKERRWRSLTGKNTRTTYIAEEMRNFYADFIPNEDVTVDRLNIVFSMEKQAAPRFILMAAFFMGITLDELLRPTQTINVVDEIRDRLAAGESMRSIARFLGVDASTVRRWSTGREPPQKSKSKRRKKASKTDWAAKDAAYLPRLNEILEHAMQGKPESITFTWAAKAMRTVSAAQLKQMPRCADLIYCRMEPIEQTWKKRLIWAEQKLTAEGKPVSETAIYRLAGVLKKRYVERMLNTESSEQNNLPKGWS